MGMAPFPPQHIDGTSRLQPPTGAGKPTNSYIKGWAFVEIMVWTLITSLSTLEQHNHPWSNIWNFCFVFFQTLETLTNQVRFINILLSIPTASTPISLIFAASTVTKFLFNLRLTTSTQKKSKVISTRYFTFAGVDWKKHSSYEKEDHDDDAKIYDPITVYNNDPRQKDPSYWNKYSDLNTPNNLRNRKISPLLRICFQDGFFLPAFWRWHTSSITFFFQ